MRGVEKDQDQIRYFYQYKPTGTKYYYHKVDRSWFKALPRTGPKTKPPPPPPRSEPTYEEEYFVPPRTAQTAMEIEFGKMHPNIRQLISLWLLAFGFQNINEVSKDAISKRFRQLSMTHHPDKGGNEENYKQLSAVRDHLRALCEIAAAVSS